MLITINFADGTSEKFLVYGEMPLRELVLDINARVFADAEESEHPIAYRWSFDNAMVGDFFIVADNLDETLESLQIVDGELLIAISDSAELIQNALFQTPAPIEWLQTALSREDKLELWMGEEAELWLSDKEIKVLERALRGNITIKELAIQEFSEDCTLATMQQLLKTITTTHITEFTLDWFPVDNMGPILKEFLQTNVRLRSLSLGIATIKEDDLCEIATALVDNKTLQSLVIINRTSGPMLTGLQAINLSLQQNRSLTHFYIHPETSVAKFQLGKSKYISELPMYESIKQKTLRNSQQQVSLLLQVVSACFKYSLSINASGVNIGQTISEHLLDYLDDSYSEIKYSGPQVELDLKYHSRMLDIGFFESPTKASSKASSNKRCREEKSPDKNKHLKPEGGLVLISSQIRVT